MSHVIRGLRLINPPMEINGIAHEDIVESFPQLKKVFSSEHIYILNGYGMEWIWSGAWIGDVQTFIRRSLLSLLSLILAWGHL
jgi:hypothetical protein